MVTGTTFEFLNVTNEMQFLKTFKVFKSCISLVTLRNSNVIMHGPMNIKKVLHYL
jgi:hypothetical protein